MASQPKNKSFPAKRQLVSSGFSYWEWKGWLEALDVVVVGGGLVGIHAALRIRENHPSWRILVMDERTVGGGGTSRNAGFACFGSPSELLDDVATMGLDATRSLVERRWKGLALLRATWGDVNLGYQALGSREAFTDDVLFEACLQQLPDLNAALEPVFGQHPFASYPDVHQSGLNDVVGSISSPLEGKLDTSKLVHCLHQGLVDNQIHHLHGFRAENIERHGSTWAIRTELGTVETPRVVIANNARASELLDLDVQPAPNHVLVSQPLPNLELRGTLHHDRGYVYARELGGRLLIGGGRQWASATPNDTPQQLCNWAKNHIRGAQHMEIQHHWVGTLGVGETREPVVAQIEHGLWAGVRMGGMGVALGALVGQELADLL